MQATIEMEDHAMSLIQSGYAVSTRRGFLGVLFPALLALALFDTGAATAQEAKQIKLTDKHIQSFMGAYEDIAKLYDGANPEPDPRAEAQAAAVAKKNGFASLDEYDDASMNIAMIMSGIDPQTKKFTEPPEQIKNEIAGLKGDKSVPEADKKEGTGAARDGAQDGKTNSVQGKRRAVAKVLRPTRALYAGTAACGLEIPSTGMRESRAAAYSITSSVIASSPGCLSSRCLLLLSLSFTGRRSNRTARRRQCCASRLGYSRRRGRARDAMSSTTATLHRRAILCGRYGQPSLSPGYCSSSCGRCDPHRREKPCLRALSRSGRRAGSVQNPHQE